jgi:hypothetical protein
LSYLVVLKMKQGLGMVVHIYNLSYSGGRGRLKFEASLGKLVQTLNENVKAQRPGGLAQVVERL